MNTMFLQFAFVLWPADHPSESGAFILCSQVGPKAKVWVLVMAVTYTLTVTKLFTVLIPQFPYLYKGTMTHAPLRFVART
jgi:hypothetical protein